ncbi:MGDG synthase family glycosyltransferase [Pseudofrankia inefficax]|uniref:Monogalactosyldiacylglycerol synthase n=1 Tax=Pseudofrankia inefficax (strain DSM 45817 / CECT 9037 / DDB 130130 / EuI1c) TaxID=298654 RepID=E3IUQ6_PSEI1|nr:Monogalactosyldiacylglycerol synthase [Pseudofrankia inefficax]
MAAESAWPARGARIGDPAQVPTVPFRPEDVPTLPDSGTSPGQARQARSAGGPYPGMRGFDVPFARPRPSGGALLLTGSLGMGHHVMAQACASSLEARQMRVRTLDSLRMLGGPGGRLGEAVFRGMLEVPGLYDAFHFNQLRTGGRIATAIDALSSRFLVPRMRDELTREPVSVVISVFATGAAAASRVKADFPGLVTVVFCTDVCPHRLWVHQNTDLYLVTSPTAMRYVRRFHPRAEIAVVPTPVRAPFYEAPTQRDARLAFGIPLEARCVLLMSGAWGLGPLVAAAEAMAAAGVWVFAVAGHNAKLARRLAALAEREHRVIPFGFTDRIPQLMAAADLVVTSSGDTCSEARVVGRDLLLLDVVPGHGRDNLQGELEKGGAEIAGRDPRALTRSVLAALDGVRPPTTRVTRGPREWEDAFGKALALVGLTPGR